MNRELIVRTLIGLAAEAKTAADHRQLAAALEAAAQQQRQLAEAKQRQQAKPPAQRVGGAGKGGRPSVPWVEIQRRERKDSSEADSLIIRLSTSLYYQIGSPERLDVQRIGGRIMLLPSREGYKVMANAGGIRINASGSRDLLPEDGKYQVEAQAGSVVLGKRM